MFVWNSKTHQIRKAIKVNETVPIPVEDMWRLPYLKRLLEQRMFYYYKVDQESKIQSLIDSLCVNSVDTVIANPFS